MKTLYIHIGTPKTGTTAIQNFCKENAHVLEKKGYCYPIFSFSYPDVTEVRAHFLTGEIKDENGKRCYEKEKENFEKGMKKVRKLFDKYNNIVLSDESIWYDMNKRESVFWKNMMQEAEKGGFRISVIVYLRRQDKFLISRWNQRLKRRMYEKTIDKHLEEGNHSIFDYYKKLQKTSKIIGKDNIKVRRFNFAKFEGGNIYADFLSAIGLSLTEEFHISEDTQNSGLYGNTHEIQRILNGLPQIKDREQREFITARLLEMSDISKQEYPCEMLSKDEIIAIMENYNEGNRKIAEEYLHEPGEELFDPVVKDIPKWEKDNPHMIDDLIRFVGVTTMYLYKENQELRKQIENSKTKMLKQKAKQYLKRMDIW